MPSLRLVSLNIAHGRGPELRRAVASRRTVQANLERVAAFLRRLGADVAALQEVDAECTWSGRFDQVGFVADRAGLPYVAFHAHTNIRRPPMGPLRYGNAVLSRYPIERHFTYSFPRRVTGRKGFCAATLNVAGRRLDVVSLHLDFARSRTRRRQVAEMIQVLDELGRERPLVLAGDFNACTAAEYPLFQVLAEWRGLRRVPCLFAEAPTYPSRRPRHAIDHVWVTPDLRFALYRVHPVRLSDHLPIEVVLEPCA